jgi:hypothetical protein
VDNRAFDGNAFHESVITQSVREDSIGPGRVRRGRLVRGGEELARAMSPARGRLRPPVWEGTLAKGIPMPSGHPELGASGHPQASADFRGYVMTCRYDSAMLANVLFI